MQNFKPYVMSRRGWRSDHEFFVWSIENDRNFPEPANWDDLSSAVAKRADRRFPARPDRRQSICGR